MFIIQYFNIPQHFRLIAYSFSKGSSSASSDCGRSICSFSSCISSNNMKSRSSSIRCRKLEKQ